jgi:2'-5' RNA ligase
MSTVRLFFAYPIAETQSQILAQWAAQLPLNNEAVKVPAENFHVTLAYVGPYPKSDIPDLIAYAETLIPPAEIQCHWRVNRLGHFRGGILYADGHNVPPQMRHLANELSFFTQHQEKHRNYIPHITLARHVAAIPKPNAFEFDLVFDRVVLFASVANQNGVSYQPLHHWLDKRSTQ